MVPTSTAIFRPYLAQPGTFGYVGGDFMKPYSVFNFYMTLPSEDDHWALHFCKEFPGSEVDHYKVGNAANIFGVGGAPQWFGGDLTTASNLQLRFELWTARPFRVARFFLVRMKDEGNNRIRVGLEKGRLE